MQDLPDVRFGSDPPLDWRDPKFADTSADDDEELTPTPTDTVGLLGFDPAEKP